MGRPTMRRCTSTPRQVDQLLAEQLARSVRRVPGPSYYFDRERPRGDDVFLSESWSDSEVSSIKWRNISENEALLYVNEV